MKLFSFPILILLLMTVFIMESCAEDRSSAQPAKEKAKICMENLKQCGVALMRYSHEAEDRLFPALGTCSGKLLFTKNEMFPKYLEEPSILLCQGEANTSSQELNTNDKEAHAQFCFDNSAYWYLGYALPDEKTALAFVKAYKKQIDQKGSFEQNLQDDEGHPLFRLKGSVVKSLIQDVNDHEQWVKLHATIPLMIERPGQHPNAIHILFLDGHVERVAYPGKFPASENFIRALQELTADGSANTN